ncbi:MAG TPA: 3D domain-containing protein [Tepidisphaeraceae bacterium]|nr:3D domain-containing protein [Tepidisphaeraceae bacterium]
MPNDLSKFTAGRGFQRFFLLAVVLGAVVPIVGWTRTSGASAQAPELLHDVAESKVGISHSTTHVVEMEVTAYCACPRCCGKNAKGLTASGRHISYNDGKFVAADTSVLPFGTKLMINGYSAQPVEVIDRGSAIKGNKLDVFFSSHEEALKWGRRKMQVTMID